MRRVDPTSTGKNGAGLRAAPGESWPDLEIAHRIGARGSRIHRHRPVVQIRHGALVCAEGEIGTRRLFGAAGLGDVDGVGVGWSIDASPPSHRSVMLPVAKSGLISTIRNGSITVGGPASVNLP